MTKVSAKSKLNKSEDHLGLKGLRFQEIFQDPGLYFNTGYLGLFGALIPILGPLPFTIMSVNWVSGCAMLAYKKNLLPTSLSGKINSWTKNNRIGKFIRRPNSALAMNGAFLIVTGLTTLTLTATQNYSQIAALLSQGIPQLASTALGSKVTFSSILALGFGSGNLKKAAELDSVNTNLTKIIPGLKNIKSEFLAAVSAMSACLMTGGWSMIAAPFILFSMKQGSNNAVNPESNIFRFTRFLATSRYVPLRKSLKEKLYRQHPQTIARGAGTYALILSVIVGAGKLIARSVAVGSPTLQPSDFATLGNIMITGGNHRLYKQTDKICGDLPKKVPISSGSSKLAEQHQSISPNKPTKPTCHSVREQMHYKQVNPMQRDFFQRSQVQQFTKTTNENLTQDFSIKEKSPRFFLHCKN